MYELFKVDVTELEKGDVNLLEFVEVDIPGGEIIGECSVLQLEFAVLAQNLDRGIGDVGGQVKDCVSFCVPHCDSKQIESAFMRFGHGCDGDIRI